MNNYLLIRITKNHIAFNKRNLRTNYGLFILNLGICAWNIFNIYSNTSYSIWLPGIGVGVTGTTCLWIWINMWEIKLDIKIEKEKLNWLEKVNETGVASLLA